MLRDSGLGILLFINLLMAFLWVMISFFFSGHTKAKRVNYKMFPYRIKNFERRGFFYVENFYIDRWYSLLPTAYNRIGITRESLKKDDELVLKERLTVTCRCELFALINCLYIIGAAIIDPPYLAFILGMVMMLANFPFAAASRYCRCLVLDELLERRKALKEQSIIAEKSLNVFDLNVF